MSVPGPPDQAGEATELSQRLGAVLDAAELEAERLRGEARAQGLRYLDNVRRQGDRLLDARRARIDELSAELSRITEGVIERLDNASREEISAGFGELVKALSLASAQLGREKQAELEASADGPG